jgi:hypothetical protein
MRVRQVITFGLFVLSAVVCLPFAFLTSALAIHAPKPLALFYPAILLIGAWIVAGLLWRAKLWIPASILLAMLIGVHLYWWSTLELL